MKKNIGVIDRAVRVLITGLFASLYFSQKITGTPGIIIISVPVVLVVTSFISFCPLYFLVGIKSANNQNLNI